MEIRTGFARAVWAEIGLAGINQAELARRTRIPIRTLRRIMLGQVDVKLRHVCAIAAALGLQSGDLVAHAERSAGT